MSSEGAHNLHSPQLADDILGDFIASADQTFNQMFGLKIAGDFKIIERDAVPTGDVSVILQLKQKDPEGVMIMTFPKESVFAILKEFYKRDFTEIDNTAMGAVGEITNIIYGVWKQRLRSKGYNYGMAIPQMVAGPPPRVPNIEWIALTSFKSEAGPFYGLLMRSKK